MNNKEYEVVFHVGRIFSEKGQDWLPTIQVLKPHEHHPAWTAALMYLILDKYIATVDDNKQEKYTQEVMKWFEAMKEGAHEHIDNVDFPEDVE